MKENEKPSLLSLLVTFHFSLFIDVFTNHQQLHQQRTLYLLALYIYSRITMQIIDLPPITIEQILQKLDQARNDDSVTELSVRGIQLTEETLPAFVDVFQSVDRVWEEINFYYCGGPMEVLLSAVLSAKVRYLCLYAGELEMPVYEALARDLPANEFLTRLRLNTRLDEVHMTLLANILSQTTTLQGLDMTGCHLGGSVVGLAEGGLRHNKSLRILTLAQCYATDEQIAAVIRAIENHPSLEELILYGNECRSEGLKAVGRLLRSSTSTLTTLDLTWQDDGHSTLQLDLSLFTQDLKTNCTLKALHLSRNEFSNGSMAALADALAYNTTLEHLSLRGCRLDCEKIVPFAETLPEMKGLKTLWLHSNPNLGQRGAEVLLDGLRQNCMLQDLVLAPCDWKCCQELSHLLDVNWGGRRLLKRNNVPTSLWPLCFGRVNQSSLPLALGDLRPPSDRRANVLYYLVREHIPRER
jgi:hypothetical protein